MSIFIQATNSGWYPEFLNPVVAAVLKEAGKILDIGTGPGALPEMLIKHDPSLEITGIDVDPAMIAEALKSNSHKNISFYLQKINAPLEFSDSQFDVVTFCSVLFLVNDSVKTLLVSEALRVLKPGGKLIVLTPSGKKAILSSFFEVWKYPYTRNNWTFIIWKIATTFSARKWQRNHWLQKYAANHQLQYSSTLTFNNNSSLEIITNKNQNNENNN